MEQKNEGICRFCYQTFSGSAIGRHLLACKAKKENDELETAKAKQRYPIYHIKIAGYNYYWLHIEMKVASTLRELDDFLRKIWLECCGHLSMFTINGINYEDNEYSDDFWGEKGKSIEMRLVEALQVGDKFQYEYDFGTTTYLQGKVLAARQGVLKTPVKILARNNPYRFECSECERPATDLCTDCESFLCEACLEAHECGEEMALPIVNSPRIGECGYTGDYDNDNFSVPAS